MIRRLGEQIRHHRLEMAFSIEELSQRSGVSVGLISQLENGHGNPSFDTLSGIAAGLGIQVGSFFQGPALETDTAVVVRKDERKTLSLPHDSPVYELLTPDLNRRVEVVWIEFAPGVSTEQYPFRHEGEEYGLVLEGTLDVHVGDETYRLGPGDSVTYSPAVPHWHHNAGDQWVRGIWVVCPPSW